MPDHQAPRKRRSRWDRQHQLKSDILSIGTAICPRFDEVELDINTRLAFRHNYLSGTAFSFPGVPDAVQSGVLSEYGKTEIVAAAKDMQRRILWASVFQEVKDKDFYRPWKRMDSPPSWALFTHPLFAYALAMNGAHDVDGKAISGGISPTPGVRYGKNQDLIIGTAPLSSQQRSAALVHCDDLGIVIKLKELLPQIIQSSARDRPLTDLIELPPSGNVLIDAAIASLVIARVQYDENGTDIFIKTAKWILCGEQTLDCDLQQVLALAPQR